MYIYIYIYIYILEEAQAAVEGQRRRVLGCGAAGAPRIVLGWAWVLIIG